MLPEEEIAVLAFIGSIAAVYIFAVGALIRAFLEKTGRVDRPVGKLQKWFRRFVYSLAAIGIFCFAYAYFIEPYRLTVRRVEVRSDKLAPGTQPIRVVHISDLHSDPAPRLEEKLPLAIEAQKPDIIVFSGDSLNSPEGLPVFKRCLTEIAKIAPTFVVKGNWDVWYWFRQELFAGVEVKELDARAEQINVRGTEIWLAGIPVGKENRVRDLLETIPKDKFSIFLYHYPDEIEKVAGSNIDLFCAGHTHGGQVALPLYGALVTLSKHGKRFEGGTYKVDNTWLNVNRGIGMEGGAAPRVRFWSTPEITVIDIIPN